MEENDIPQPEQFGDPGPQAPPPQQEQFLPPGLMEPYSNADDLQLSKLQSGIAAIRQQGFDGELHPEEVAEYTQDLLRSAAPLAARKKIADAQKQQEELHNALAGSAVAKSVEHHNAVFDARGFGDRAAYVKDPVTGATAVYVQEQPGKFVKADFGDQADPYAAGEGAGGSFVPATDTGVSDAARPEAEYPADTSRAGQPLTIVNGQDRQVFQDGRLIEHTDIQGRPALGPGQANDGRFGLNKETLDFVHQMAAAGSMHLPPGVQRNAMYSHLYQQGVMQAVQEQAAAKRAGVQMEHDQRMETAKASQKEANDMEGDRTKLRSEIARAVHGEYTDGRKMGEVPAGLNTVQGRAAEVESRMAEIWGHTHPGLDHSQPVTPAGLKAWREGGKGAAKGSQEEPAATPPAAEGVVKTKSDLAILGAKAGMTGKQLVDMTGHLETEVAKDTAVIAQPVTDPETGIQYGAPGRYADLPKKLQVQVAEQRAKDRLSRLTATPGAAQQQPEVAPKAVEPLKPGQVNLADVLAEEERRKRAKGGSKVGADTFMPFN